MSALPEGACDSHVHVFDPDRFAYAPGRAYTPGPALVADLRVHLARLGLDRCVVVQPSVHGTDNRCLLATLAGLGPQVARGVTDDDLARLHAAGVRACG